jgi:predicted nucleic acid-binding protein
VYADSSFLVSLYVTDKHSPISRQSILRAPGLWFTPLHNAEWAHTVGQHVFRGKFLAAEANQLYRLLDQDKSAGIWVESGLPERAFDLCGDLGRRFGPKLGVRTLDTLHVACAVELKAQDFWTFDDRQARLAKTVGLKLL